MMRLRKGRGCHVERDACRICNLKPRRPGSFDSLPEPVRGNGQQLGRFQSTSGRELLKRPASKRPSRSTLKLIHQMNSK